MASKKNQKRYNKAMMESGLKSNEYINTNLGLIQKYVTDYAGRQDFWLNRLNNRQLDLLSDKYLAQNANMLRGQAAFGSNSETNRQIENNAYSQQNYLANVANQNVMNANQLQNAELNALSGATQLNYANRNYGQQAAANVDAANNAWLGAVGKGMQAVGGVASMFGPVGAAVGAGLQGVGGALSGMAAPTYDYTQDQRQNWQTQFSAARGNKQVQNILGNQDRESLSMFGNTSNTSPYSGSILTNELYNQTWGGY